MRSRVVYFDNNATTRVAPAVREAMQPYLDYEYGNPSSAYSFAYASQDALLAAHEQVAALLGAKPGEIIMTSCGTESDATAINAAREAQPRKKHFITTRVEHPAVLAVGEYLEKHGYRVTYLPVDAKGRLDLADLKKALSDDTFLVSVMFANNETGNIYPIAEAGALCRERGVLFHTDAVQAVGKIPINLAELPVDYLTMSGHKLHAPKGVGALYARLGAPFAPFLLGGHQEYGRRAGTQAVPNIVALGKACELAAQNLDLESARMLALRDDLQKRLLESIPDVLVNGDEENRLPNTLNLSFKNADSEAILAGLDEYGICASSGSACTAHSKEPSHVIMAMGPRPEYAQGAIRLSLSGYTTRQDVDFLAEKMPLVVRNLRESQAKTPQSC